MSISAISRAVCRTRFSWSSRTNMHRFVLCATVCATLPSLVPAQGSSTLFPPGWNKEAVTPPMGWRSWNAFGANINNATFVTAIDAITANIWDVAGGKASLADVGYKSVGIDEGWENCSGANPNDGQRQHDADGFPMVDTGDGLMCYARVPQCRCMECCSTGCGVWALSHPISPRQIPFDLFPPIPSQTSSLRSSGSWTMATRTALRWGGT